MACVSINELRQTLLFPTSVYPCTCMAFLRVYKTGVCELWVLFIFAPDL